MPVSRPSRRQPESVTGVLSLSLIFVPPPKKKSGPHVAITDTLAVVLQYERRDERGYGGGHLQDGFTGNPARGHQGQPEVEQTGDPAVLTPRGGGVA